MIRTQAELEALIGRLRRHDQLAVDCEFHSEGTYHPRLCLVQLHGGEEAAAIDPFEVDLRPLGALLADAEVQKVLHAAETDLQLLARATGATIRNVFDTQVAAGFVGREAAPSYALLVERTTGVVLSKTLQYTDWRARPLSAEQVDYALNDVRHLPAVAAALHKELARRGRADWAACEQGERVAKALAPRDRARLWLKLGPFKDLSSRQLAILREVAAWRDGRAEELDWPVQRVAPDRALRQLAFEPPRTPRDLEGSRGLQGVGAGARGLLAAVERALTLPEADCPPMFTPRARDERVEPVGQLLATALRARGQELDLAPSLLANRDELEALAAWHFLRRDQPPPEPLVPGTWKHAAAGDLLLGLLEGRLALAVDPGAPTGVIARPAR
jgi:ribonuclease D